METTVNTNTRKMIEMMEALNWLEAAGLNSYSCEIEVVDAETVIVWDYATAYGKTAVDTAVFAGRAFEADLSDETSGAEVIDLETVRFPVTGAKAAYKVTFRLKGWTILNTENEYYNTLPTYRDRVRGL